MEDWTWLRLVVPGLATDVGGLGPLAVRRPSERLLDILRRATGRIPRHRGRVGFAVMMVLDSALG